MIDYATSPAAWALLLDELSDATEHLSSLVTQAASAGRIDEVDFGIQLSHIYAHLNRAWNARHDPRLVEHPTDDEGDELRQYPKDLPPLA